MRVDIFEDSEERQPGTVQLQVWDPLPNVPYWMQIDLEPGTHPFWTLPSGHFFERTPGEMGFPGHLQTIARKYAAGEMDKATAETQIAETLAGWSKATTWSWHDDQQTTAPRST